MDTKPPTNSPQDLLQFDRIEPLANGPAAATCARCQQGIATAYYAVGDRILCESCRQAFIAALQGGSRFLRFAKAFGAGLAAAAVCSAGWFAVTKLTGYEFGLIAVVVGVVVGIAVRKGASSRGGWLYQGMAILLTYLAIACSHVPEIIGAITESAVDRQSALVRSDKERSRITICRDGSVKLNDDASSPEEAGKEMRRLKSVDGFVMYYREGREEMKPPPSADLIAKEWTELDLPVVYCSDPGFQNVGRGLMSFGNAPFRTKFLLAAVSLYVAVQVPFIDMGSNLIGLLIIGFALWEAWKINKRAFINITGPHLLNPAGGGR